MADAQMPNVARSWVMIKVVFVNDGPSCSIELRNCTVRKANETKARLSFILRPGLESLRTYKIRDLQARDPLQV